MQTSYSQFRGQYRTLGDYLALDRTVLANERTLLAYARTALAIAVVGGTALKFFDSVWIRGLGISFILGSMLVAARGWVRYSRTRQLLATAFEHEPGTSGSLPPNTA